MSIGLKLLTLFIPEIIRAIREGTKRRKARKAKAKRLEILERRRAAAEQIRAANDEMNRKRKAADTKRRMTESFEKNRAEIVGAPKKLDENPY